MNKISRHAQELSKMLSAGFPLESCFRNSRVDLVDDSSLPPKKNAFSLWADDPLVNVDITMEKSPSLMDQSTIFMALCSMANSEFTRG